MARMARVGVPDYPHHKRKGQSDKVAEAQRIPRVEELRFVDSGVKTINKTQSEQILLTNLPCYFSYALNKQT